MPTISVNEIIKSGFGHAWMEFEQLVIGDVSKCPKCGEPIEEANSLRIQPGDEYKIRKAIADQFIKYWSPAPLQPGYYADGQVSDECENCFESCTDES